MSPGCLESSARPTTTPIHPPGQPKKKTSAVVVTCATVAAQFVFASDFIALTSPTWFVAPHTGPHGQDSCDSCVKLPQPFSLPCWWAALAELYVFLPLSRVCWRSNGGNHRVPSRPRGRSMAAIIAFLRALSQRVAVTLARNLLRAHVPILSLERPIPSRAHQLCADFVM